MFDRPRGARLHARPARDAQVLATLSPRPAETACQRRATARTPSRN